MPDLRFWLCFVAAFTIVIAILMVGAAVHAWWDCKKGQMTAEDRMGRALVKILIVAALAIVVVVVALTKAFAHDHDHPELDQWYAGLMQPDNPTASCCGKSDAYWCDDYFAKDGKAYCRITDDREVPGRPPVPVGTEIEIPERKLKWDRGNPTGHAVVFLSSGGSVFCFVQGAQI